MKGSGRNKFASLALGANNMAGEKYRFFVKNATVVLQNFYNSTQHFKSKRWRNVVHGGKDEEQAILQL